MPSSILSLSLLLALTSGASRPVPIPSQDDEEIAAMVAAERAEADLLRRRGRLSAARRQLTGLLAEEPEDAQSLRLLALCRLEEGRHQQALRHAREALGFAAASGDGTLEGACARTTSLILSTLGDYSGALEVLLSAGGDRPVVSAGESARSALALGLALIAEGDHEAGRRTLEFGLEVRRDAPWEEHHAMGRCARELGRLQLASRAFVLADRIARSGVGSEPDVLSALAGIYFESEREVEAPEKRSAGALYREALTLHPNHAGALLGLFELHRYNRRRHSRSPEEILGQLLQVVPNSIDGLLAKVSADLSDGRLKAARGDLERLEALAPARRELLTMRAALAWIEHRREDCERILAERVAHDPADSVPEREVGRHLLELYRFAEATEFLGRAVGRDDKDWEAWTLYGRALANTGREDEAREALERAERVAGGRQDAWRNNTRLVLSRMASNHVLESHGSLEYSWRPEVADVLRIYFVPFYQQARGELSQRYGFTPGATRIEVFRAHQDFSVRSVGFEGFPALGVCFGPVVTALSPLSEMRGKFSWTRTGFHEFSHVVHLGLSHNRCPRWITEGLATWEEVQRNPTWTRNMRRQLLDSYANEDLIPVRELNRAFRGPRILFGYYQGGLLCQMLIDRFGFSPMIRLLEAFDEGSDLDQALGEVFDLSPEEVDADFAVYVDGLVDELRIEPRWSPERIVRLRLSLEEQIPEDPVRRAEWADSWVTVAWGSWQRMKRLDAEEGLRRAAQAGPPTPRALFLRGELELQARRTSKAREAWSRALEAGGRDYRALIGLGSLCEAAGDLEEAERCYLMAQDAFPGYDEQALSAELKLVALYEGQGREDEAMAARERWLAWNAGVFGERMRVARWHAEAGRAQQAESFFAQANEVDPFRRDLHLSWADVLLRLERWEEALREFDAALKIPPDLDLDHLRYVGPPGGLPPGVDPDQLPPGVARGLAPGLTQGQPLEPSGQTEILLRMAECAEQLGRLEEAHSLRERAAAQEPED